jgi:Flp pilus assembly protein TadB
MKMSEGGWRSAAAIAVSVIAAVAVTVIVVGPYAGIIAGLVVFAVAIALDWETRRRREAATRSKAD